MGKNISREERILGLSRIWRDVKFYFARFYDVTSDEKWDTLYCTYLPLVAKAEDLRHYYELLLRFVATLNDGHTYILVPDEVRPPYRIAIGTTYIDGKHILIKAPKQHEDFLYGEILSVNGRKLEAYLDEFLYPLVWHESKTSRFYYGLLGYVIGCTEHGTITIGTDKGEFSVTAREDTETVEKNLYITLPEIEQAKNICRSENLDIVITKDHIGIIGFHACTKDVKEYLYQNADRLKDCRGFLIDVRTNSGGSDYASRAVASLFFEHPITGGKYLTRLINPWEAAHGGDIEKQLTDITAEPDVFEVPFHTDRPVAVLVGGITASAAESFLVMMKNDDRAVFIGERSAGTNGQPLIRSLPGGGNYAVCTQKCLMDNMVDYNNVGIQPDIECYNTLKDYENHYDRVMAEGLNYIRNQCQNFCAKTGESI